MELQVDLKVTAVDILTKEGLNAECPKWSWHSTGKSKIPIF